MNRLLKVVVWVVKLTGIGIAFFTCFAITILVVALLGRLCPGWPFFIQVLPIIPMMMAANRFVLSPLEFHLNMKTLQYDSWYERRRKAVHDQ